MNLPTAWKLTTRIAAFVGLLLALIAVFELIRIYVFLYRVRPDYAWIFAGIVVAAFLGLLSYVIAHWWASPSHKPPPPLPPLTEATHPQLKRAAQYRITRLQQLTRNPLVSDESIAILNDEIDTLDGLLHHHPLNEDLIRIIQKCDQEILPPIHAELQEAAHPIVREHIRQAMLREITGPRHTSHPTAILYQQAKLIDSIVHAFVPNPAIRMRMQYIRDVLQTGQRDQYADLECLLANRIRSESLPQAVAAACAAGLQISVLANIAAWRCTICHPWEDEITRDEIAALLPVALADVKTTLIEDILPAATHCLTAEPQLEHAPDQIVLVKLLQECVKKAFHKLPQKAEQTARQPQTNPMAVKSSATTFARPAPIPRPPHQQDRMPPHHGRHRVKRRRGLARILYLLRQRIKYTSGMGR